MKNMGVIYGSKMQAQPLIIGTDTVYVHTNIKLAQRSLDETLSNLTISEMYEYEEVQYTKDEYIKLLSEKNDALNTHLLETQLALCDIYEKMVK